MTKFSIGFFLGALIAIGAFHAGKASEPYPLANADLYTVEFGGVFADSVAHGARRSIYVVTEKATGRRFLGISGVGISEIER
ncbi:MAG TPA: hypothetical protein VKY70_00900 [Pseudomonas sp.]|nr:hypothetical protein [Pseudomonas sp.]